MENRNSGNKHSIRFLFLFLFFPFSQCHGKDTAYPGFQSGTYWGGGARIALHGDLVTGAVDIVTGGGSGVCQFAFAGKLTGDSGKFASRNYVDGGLEPGFLSAITDSSFRIRFESGPPCSHIYNLPDTASLLVKLVKPDSFIQVRIVLSEKAFFFSGPDSSNKRKAYLVKENEALVYNKNGDWLKVIFGKTTGWIRERDMYPLGLK